MAAKVRGYVGVLGWMGAKAKYVDTICDWWRVQGFEAYPLLTGATKSSLSTALILFDKSPDSGERQYKSRTHKGRCDGTLRGGGVTGGRQVGCSQVVHKTSVDPSFRALTGRLKFTVRRHKLNKDSPGAGRTSGPLLSDVEGQADGSVSAH